MVIVSDATRRLAPACRSLLGESHSRKPRPAQTSHTFFDVHDKYLVSLVGVQGIDLGPADLRDPAVLLFFTPPL